MLSEKDFEAVLITFCYYDHDAQASKAVQQIATDQEEYRKLKRFVFVDLQEKPHIFFQNKQDYF